jgi:hypothetical protein
MRKLKNKILFVLLIFILPGRMYAQSKVHVDLVDSVQNQFTEIKIGAKDTLVVTKKDSIKAYIITSYFLNSYTNLINLYEKKDRIRILSGNSMDSAYEYLFNEYQKLGQDIQHNMEKSNGLITGVQSDIDLARNDVKTAATNISGAQNDIRESKLIITNAQDNIKSAIEDLKKVKKMNQAWIYTAVGVGGLLIGMLISR